jgi:hypothetical protein
MPRALSWHLSVLVFGEMVTLMRSSKATLAFCVLTAALSAGTTAQTPSTPVPIDVQKLGPQIGARVPDFSLPDQQGQTRTLQSVMGPKGALLVFFRSADW